MGKVIRGCRRGKGSVFKSHTSGRIGAMGMKRADYNERKGYSKGVVKAITHDKVGVCSCVVIAEGVVK